MAFSSPLRTFGIVLAFVLCASVVLSILHRDCACTEEGECFCLDANSTLHTVTEEEIANVPEPQQSEYRAFLTAWEEEYGMRKQEWMNLYTTFYTTEHDTMTEQSFDEQIARSHQSFVELFQRRHVLFRERIGLSNE